MTAAPAPRGFNADMLAGRACGPKQVLEVIFYLVARQFEFMSNGGGRPRLAEHLGNLLANGHLDP